MNPQKTNWSRKIKQSKNNKHVKDIRECKKQKVKWEANWRLGSQSDQHVENNPLSHEHPTFKN